MNKFITTLILVLSTLNLLYAQDSYVKFLKDTEIKSHNITCLKGEIFASRNTSVQDKINVLLGADSISGYNAKSPSIEIIQQPSVNYSSRKDEFVKAKKGGDIYINVTSIGNDSDTILFVSEKGEQTILATRKDTTLKQAKCGKSFRLIVPNSPTIFYSATTLTEFVEKPLDFDLDGIADLNDKCPDKAGVTSDDPEKNGCPQEVEKTFFASLGWWHYLLFILILGGIGFSIWWFIFRKKPIVNKSPLKTKYSGGSLNNFAKDCSLSLSELIKLNKDIIPKNYDTMADFDRKECQKKLKKIGYLTTGYSKSDEVEVTGSSDFGQLRIDETSQKESVFVAEQRENTNQFNTNSDYAISQQIQNLETKLVQEIRNAGSRNNDNSNELNKLNREISDLKIDKNKLESEKRNLDSVINQLRNEKDNSERSIDSIREEKNQKITELNKLQDKVITVDFLTAYSDGVLAYLKLCNEVSSDAFDYFNRISQQNLHDAFAAGHLLMTFQNSVNAIPVGNWMQIAQDIKDTGATTNKKLIRSFSQIQNEEERKREFQRLLYSEVLVKYSSSILILAEAFRNLGRFQVSSELVNDAQNTFSKHVLELVSKVKATGLENKYVALFKNFEDFLGQAELVDREKSFAYKGITGLEKGAIVEIVSYGVKTNFEETKTLIILA